MCSNIIFFIIRHNFIVIFLIIILIVKVFIITELNLLKFPNLITILIIWYPDNCPTRKIAPQLVLGFESRLGTVLGLGGNQTMALEENCHLDRVSFGVGAVFLGGNCSRT